MYCSNNASNGKTSCTSKCFKIGLLAIIGIAALGAVVMLIWNWLMPAVFIGAREISFLQALGILLLSKILFGSFHGRCHGRWRERQQRWESMSPEEREQLKGHFHGRWGRWCCPEKRDDSTPKDATPNAE